MAPDWLVLCTYVIIHTAFPAASCSVDRAWWQTKMASTEYSLPRRNALGPHRSSRQVPGSNSFTITQRTNFAFLWVSTFEFCFAARWTEAVVFGWFILLCFLFCRPCCASTGQMFRKTFSNDSCRRSLNFVTLPTMVWSRTRTAREKWSTLSNIYRWDRNVRVLFLTPSKSTQAGTLYLKCFVLVEDE